MSSASKRFGKNVASVRIKPKTLPESKNEQRHLDAPRMRWHEHARAFPELKLSQVEGDNLSFLLSGSPDPRISLQYYKAVWTSLNGDRAIDASRQLLEFRDKHLWTFIYSGWVRIAVGEIVLSYEDAAKTFVKSYWKKRRTTNSRDAALGALGRFQGEHWKHLRRAAGWVRRFRDRNHDSREADFRFAQRAFNAYHALPRNKTCSCLTDDVLKNLAIVAISYPDLSDSKLAEQTLAALYPTSRSTLIHLRASLNKQAQS